MKTKSIDTVIIGGGPAGLQLGNDLRKAGRDYVILEKGKVGQFFRKFPRHRKLISINKVYTGYSNPDRNLRWDWNSLLSDDPRDNFTRYSKKYFPDAEDFVRYVEDFTKRHKLNVKTGVTVKKVSRPEPGGDFVLTTNKGKFFAKKLVVATGNSKPFIPNIPGIEHAEQYMDVSVNPKHFMNKRVLVLGKGNSAFETADALVETAALIHVASPHPVRLAWQTRWVGDLRAVNNNILDTYHLKLQNAILDVDTERIVKLPNGKLRVDFHYKHAGDERESIVYDHVICATGWRFDASIFDETCKPNLAINDRYPDQKPGWESVNVPDLFFTGALTQMRDFHKANSSFIHGFRYNARTLFHLLEERYHNVPYPRTYVAATPEALSRAIIKRLETTSALWQQFAWMADVMVVDGDRIEIRPEVPLEVAAAGELAKRDYFAVTLEFGRHEGDPFALDRNSDFRRAELSAFLHPVVRYFSKGKEVSVHHIFENLFAEWEDETKHVSPLREYLKKELAPKTGKKGKRAA